MPRIDQLHLTIPQERANSELVRNLVRGVGESSSDRLDFYKCLFRATFIVPTFPRDGRMVAAVVPRDDIRPMMCFLTLSEARQFRNLEDATWTLCTPVEACEHAIAYGHEGILLYSMESVFLVERERLALLANGIADDGEETLLIPLPVSEELPDMPLDPEFLPSIAEMARKEEIAACRYTARKLGKLPSRLAFYYSPYRSRKFEELCRQKAQAAGLQVHFGDLETALALTPKNSRDLLTEEKP